MYPSKAHRKGSLSDDGQFISIFSMNKLSYIFSRNGSVLGLYLLSIFSAALESGAETLEFTSVARRGDLLTIDEDGDGDIDRSEPHYQTIVAPIGELIGAPISSEIEPWNQGPQIKHYSVESNAHSLPSRHPLFVFGNKFMDNEPSGGEALYTKRTYSVVVNIGRAASNKPFKLDIWGFREDGTWGYIRTNFFTIPTPWTNGGVDYSDDLANGSDSYSYRITGIGLELTFRPVAGSTLGTESENYIITFNASTPDYYYVLWGKGSAIDVKKPNYDPVTDLIPLAKNNSGSAVYQRLFEMSFVDQPDTLSDTLLKPSFETEPMPPMYWGMSPDEIADNLPKFKFSSEYPVLTANFDPNNGPFNTDINEFLKIDHSPELRRHPILDDFVVEMGKKKSSSVSQEKYMVLALANYVQNQIELTDALVETKNNGGVVCLGLRGISRSALAVFQEEQGSPIEQCALLVYLLREAGIPAFYMQPYPNRMKLTESQLAAMLGIQIAEFDQNRLIAVNYPFVAAYVEGEYQYFFPWIKDTEIIEGFDLYDLMPPKWNTAYKWFAGYIQNDPEINDLADTDQPDVLWPKFIEAQIHDPTSLQHYYPFVSIDDIGISRRNRTTFFPTFEDFPRPFSIMDDNDDTDDEPTAFESYGLSEYRDYFNTKKLKIVVDYDFNNDGTASDVIYDSGDWLECDLHNRRFFAYASHFSNDGSGSNIWRLNYHIVLQPYRPGESVKEEMSELSSPDFFAEQSDAVFAFKKSLNISVDSSGEIKFSEYYKNAEYIEECKVRYIVPSGSGKNTWAVVPERDEGSVFFTRDHSSRFSFGDSVAFCSNAGRVTDRMLDVHASDIVKHQGERDKAYDHGVNLYLMGQSYWKRRGDFYDFVNDKHKISKLSSSSGLARVRLILSNISAGRLYYSYPAIDVHSDTQARIWSGQLHPRGRDATVDRGYYESQIISQIGGSAFEHGIISDFWKGIEATSTMHMLRNSNAILLTYSNYKTLGADTYLYGEPSSSPDAEPLSQQLGGDMWGYITDVFDNDEYENKELSFAWVTPGLAPQGSRFFRAASIFSSGTEFRGDWIGSNSTGLEGGGYAITKLVDAINRILLEVARAVGKATQKVHVSVPANETSSVEAQGSASAAPDISTDTPAEVAAQASNAPQAATEQQTEQIEQSNKDSDPDTSITAADAAVQGAGKGSVATQNNSETSATAGDPVNIKTGAFIIDETDVSLPGPFPLELRRSYSSQDASYGHFGWGWKLSFLPYLVFNQNNGRIRAAEMNGNVIQYEKATLNDLPARLNYLKDNDGLAEAWLPAQDENPEMTNNNTYGIGSLANPYQNIIVKFNSLENGKIIERYNLYASNGEIREYVVYSFPRNGFERKRPYLVQWADPQGNKLLFEYEWDSTKSSYGQMIRVAGASGVYLNLIYDAYGRIYEANTSDGRWFKYEYDKHNTLRRVIRPDNSVVSYEYQIEEANHNGGTIEYTTMAITKVEHPDGRVLINEYDEKNRVVRQYTTVGKDLIPVENAKFKYDERTVEGKTFQENIITDIFGNETTYQIFDGMITGIINPLGQTEYRYYFINETDYFDAKEQVIKSNGTDGYPRSLMRTIDKRGLVTRYGYDSHGNLKYTQQTGHFTGTGKTETITTKYSYDEYNRLTKIWEPQIDDYSNVYRNVTEFVYNLELASYTEFPASILRRNQQPNHAYLPKLIIKRNGAKLLSATFRSYEDIKVGEYYANGLLKKEIRAFGAPEAATTTFSNSRRLPLGFADERTDVAKTEATDTLDPNVTVSLQYNQRGELVTEHSPDTTVRRYDYDTMGRLTGTRVFDGFTGANDNEPLSWNFTYYNENGEVTWTDGPGFGTDDNGAEDYVFRDYDGAGRLIAELVWRTQAKNDASGVEAVSDQHVFEGQAMTTYQYDGFGNLTSMIDPEGTVTTYEYDALGRTTSMKVSDSENGPLSEETYTYWPGNDLKSVTNGEGGKTSYIYSSTGKLIQQNNPDGTVQNWIYHKDGRPFVVIHKDGTRTQYVYDDNNFTVKAVVKGTGLPATPNSGESNPTVTTVTDKRGNVISSTDMGGKTFTTQYDGLNRVKRTFGPATSNQLIEEYSYVPQTRFSTVTNQAGEKVVTKVDALGRPVLTQIFDGAVEVERVGHEYSADFYSSTTWRGNPKQAETTTWFNTYGQPVIVRHADDTYTIAEYDKNGNLTNSWDELGQESQFTYDGLNRLTSSTTPDGAITSLDYNLIGNLTKRVMPGNLVWSANYHKSGRITSEQLSQGAETTREFSYAYYPAYKKGTASPDFKSAKLKRRRDDLRSIDYNYNEYDGLGRLVEMQTTGSSAVYHLTQTFSYDLRGNLTNLEQDYTDSSLDDSEVIRTYDDYSRLLSERITRDGDTPTDLTQVWDNAGRREHLRKTGTSASAPELAFDYNAAGRMTSVVSRVGGTTRTFGYQYDNAGFLNLRTGPFREREITSRDDRGRPLSISIRTSGASSPFLTEMGVQWREDSKLEQFSIARVGAPITGEDRIYVYNERGQLTQEQLKRAASQVVTIDYGFDDSKLGVMKSMQVDNHIPGDSNKGFVATLGNYMRLEETNIGGQFVPLSGSISQVGDGFKLQWHEIGSSDWQEIKDYKWTDEARGDWEANIAFGPGNYELKAEAIHESGIYYSPPKKGGLEQYRSPLATSDSDTVSFEVTAAYAGQPVSQTYDDAGFTTARTWGGGQAQAFKWDALGRLIELEQTGTGAFTFEAVYDGFGRRLRTEYTPSGEATVVEKSLYDPMVEFLELAVYTQGQWVWKIHGPDMGGGYGGLQGIGGIEAFIEQNTGDALGAVTDLLGNIVATIDSNQSVTWSDTLMAAYGPLPGTTVYKLDGTAASPVEALAAATAWRSRRIDPTGYMAMGARYYDPLAGRFLSPDPLGHAASMDLYSYANGDPINFVDPTGRGAEDYQEGDPIHSPIDNFLDSIFGDHWTSEQKKADATLWTAMQRGDITSAQRISTLNNVTPENSNVVVLGVNQSNGGYVVLFSDEQMEEYRSIAKKLGIYEGNSTMILDEKGKDSGHDRYNSLNPEFDKLSDAIIFASRALFLGQVTIGREFGTVYIKNLENGKYSISDLISGDPNGREVNLSYVTIPSGYQRVGSGHSHPGVNDSGKTLRQQDPFSKGPDSNWAGDKYSTPRSQFNTVVEPSKNIFIYFQNPRNFDTGLGRPYDLDPLHVHYRTSGDVLYFGNLNGSVESEAVDRVDRNY